MAAGGKGRTAETGESPVEDLFEEPADREGLPFDGGCVVEGLGRRVVDVQHDCVDKPAGRMMAFLDRRDGAGGRGVQRHRYEPAGLRDFLAPEYALAHPDGGTRRSPEVLAQRQYDLVGKR